MLTLLWLIHKSSNTVSNYSYFVGLFPVIETVLISSLVQELQHLVKMCTYPLFMTHTHAYYDLPGFIAEETKQGDTLTCPIFILPEQKQQ